MKAGDIRVKTEDELTGELDNLGKEIFNLRFQRANGWSWHWAHSRRAPRNSRAVVAARFSGLASLAIVSDRIREAFGIGVVGRELQPIAQALPHLDLQSFVVLVAERRRAGDLANVAKQSRIALQITGGRDSAVGVQYPLEVRSSYCEVSATLSHIGHGGRGGGG